MATSKLDTAVKEAVRFLELATDYQAAQRREKTRVAEARRSEPDQQWKHYEASFPAKSGAVRRASMDLTRSLAALRRPGA